MDRNELAARLLTALYTAPGQIDEATCVKWAVSGADALLLALTPPTVAPVAPPAGKYVPAVGDVCRYVNDRDGSTFVITLVDADGVRWKRTGADNAFQVLSTWPEDIRFVRDSTDAEKRAAGLAVPPPATAGDKRTTGLYEKFRVERTDGKSAPGQKHEGCRYFVLDVTHDPLAPPALRAYAASARAAGYGPLADDLDAMAWKATPPTAPTTPAPEAKRDGYDALTDAEGRDLVEAIDRTKAERAAFDKDDAPEAKRPTHVRVTRKRDSASTFWTVGKVYPVVSWDCGDPRCVSDDGSDKYIRTYEWEPCDPPAPCPPPVEGSVDERPTRVRLTRDIRNIGRGYEVLEVVEWVQVYVPRVKGESRTMLLDSSEWERAS